VRDGEAFAIEFHSVAQAGDQASTTNADYFDVVSLDVGDTNKSVEFDIFIYNDADNTSEQVYDNLLVDDQTTPTIVIAGSTLTSFNRVEIYAVGGDAKTGQGVRFDTLSQTKTILPQDFSLAFEVTAMDGDGDTTVLQGFTVSVDASPPVVLDLDGDGVEFVGRDAGAVFDYDNDGLAEPTGWVGPDDGILVRDLGGDGLVTSAPEFVFGGSGQTDLQALATLYGDSLDGADADFAQFAVWRDANSDGVSDAGEVVSLADYGIESIGLVSDGASYSAAGGDVAVHGESSFVRADGSVGVVADASFATSQAKLDVRSQEMAINAGVAGILATALVGDADAQAGAARLIVTPSNDDVPTSEAGTATLTGEAGGSTGLLDAFVSDGSDGAPTHEPSSASPSQDDSSQGNFGVGEVVDHDAPDLDAASSEQDAGAGSGQSLIVAANSDGGDVMEGLLLLGGSQPTGEGQDNADLGAVQDVLAVAESESFVDDLTQGLGSTDSDEGSGADGENFVAILDIDVSGGGVPLTLVHDFNQTMEDASAAAAA
jgi:hypothetical protein